MKGRMRMPVWLNNISIFKKLMLSFMVLSLIPIVCIGVISYTLAYRTIYRDLSRSLTLNQQHIAETINEQLSAIDDFLSKEIYDRQFQQQVRAHAGGMVTDAAVQQSCAQIVADANLPIRVTNAVYIPARRDATVPLRPSTDEDYLLSVSRQEDTLYFTKSVCNLYTEEVLGELRISVSLLSFLDEYLQMDREEYGFLLFDQQGNRVFVNWNITVDTGRPTAAFMANQPAGSCTFNGERYITAREEFPAAGWVLYCFVPQRLLQTQVNAILVTTATAVLVCIVSVLVLSLVVSYSMTARLNVMVNRMNDYRVDDAQLPVRDDLGGDEIGQLSEFFDLMSQRNARLIEEVYESKLEQQEMEQRALQAQIKPHFLYNCLDNINIRALMLGDDQISNVVTMLADFYRTSLNKGRSATRVSNEIKNVKSYLSLLTAMGGKFRVEYDIDEQAEPYTLISLTLQPLVENAYQHGAFHMGADGLIRLSIQKKEQNLVISVFNNGSQITKQEAEKALTHKGDGYGLKNVNTRIQLFFGKEYGVKIGAVEGGTECVVTIPAILYRGEERGTDIS